MEKLIKALLGILNTKSVFQILEWVRNALLGILNTKSVFQILEWV